MRTRRATHAYAASSADELSIREGDIILVVGPGPDPGWLLGSLAGRQGLFPETFTVLVDEQPLAVKPKPNPQPTGSNGTQLGQSTLEAIQSVKLRHVGDVKPATEKIPNGSPPHSGTPNAATATKVIPPAKPVIPVATAITPPPPPPPKPMASLNPPFQPKAESSPSASCGNGNLRPPPPPPSKPSQQQSLPLTKAPPPAPPKPSFQQQSSSVGLARVPPPPPPKPAPLEQQHSITQRAPPPPPPPFPASSTRTPTSTTQLPFERTPPPPPPPLPASSTRAPTSTTQLPFESLAKPVAPPPPPKPSLTANQSTSSSDIGGFRKAPPPPPPPQPSKQAIPRLQPTAPSNSTRLMPPPPPLSSVASAVKAPRKETRQIPARPMDRGEQPPAEYCTAGKDTYSCSISVRQSFMGAEKVETFEIQKEDRSRVLLTITQRSGESTATCEAVITEFRPLTSEQLRACSQKYGPKIVEFCQSNIGSRVGDGECWSLGMHSFKYAGCAPPISYNFGQEIPLEDAAPGDILQFKSCVFEFPNGLRQWAGAPDHTAVVIEPANGLKIAVLEQNPKPVSPGVYDFSGLKSGTVKLYRCLPPS